MRKRNRAITEEERIHLLRVKRLPCSICHKAAPSQAHHTDTKMGLKKDHNKVIPLCYEHHQGKKGIHHLGRKTWETAYNSEDYHLRKTRENYKRKYEGVAVDPFTEMFLREYHE